MPFVAIPNTAKIEVVGHEDVTLIPVVNVLHALCTAPVTLAQCVGINAEFVAETLAAVGDYGNNMVWDFVRTTGLDTATSPQATAFFPAGTVGTGGVGLPAALCGLVKLTTATRGRSFRGRIYDGIRRVGDVGAENNMAGPIRTALDAKYTAISAGLVTTVPNCVGLAVASRHLGVSNVVTGIATEANAGYQRRRVNR